MLRKADVLSCLLELPGREALEKGGEGQTPCSVWVGGAGGSVLLPWDCAPEPQLP